MVSPSHLGDPSVHPLVKTQRFARSEFLRGLEGLTDAEAQFRPSKADGSQMNCISWIVGHMASQEDRFFVSGITPARWDERLSPYVTGKPACTPGLSEALSLWSETTARADEWLENADDEALRTSLQISWLGNAGTALMRNTYHYWFHCGEVNAIRQLLGHPEIIFVGQMQGRLEYPLLQP